MEAAHLLHGRAWKFDREDHHGGFTNNFPFVCDSRKIIVSSLSRQKVVKMKYILDLKESKKNKK